MDPGAKVRFECDLVAVNGPRMGSRNQRPRAFLFFLNLNEAEESARPSRLQNIYSTRNVTRASTGSFPEYAFRLCPLSSA